MNQKFTFIIRDCGIGSAIVGGRGGLGAFLGADFLGDCLRGTTTSSSSVSSVSSNTKRGFGL